MSNANNSGKRKMNEVVAGSYQQSPRPQATNQFDLSSFNAGSRGNFPSPTYFPPRPNGHGFASPTNLTPLFNSHHFASPSNLTPLSRGHRGSASPNNLTPLSYSHQFATPSNIPTPPVGQLFASPSNFHSASNVRLHPHEERILNAASPVRPYTYMSLIMADDPEDPMETEMICQSEEVNQIITRHAKLLENAIGGMLEKQQKCIRDAADKQVTKKLKQKEAELQLKSAHNKDLERMAEHYKKEAEKLSARVKHLEDYTKSLKLSMGQASVPCNNSQAAHEDSSSSPQFIDPENVGGAIIIDCMVCETQLATVMMLPCRHVSVCKRCNAVTEVCPVCYKLKRASAEALIRQI